MTDHLDFIFYEDMGSGRGGLGGGEFEVQILRAIYPYIQYLITYLVKN